MNGGGGSASVSPTDESVGGLDDCGTLVPDVTSHSPAHDVISGGGRYSSSAYSAAQICCLIDAGEQCNRLAGNASYSKRIQKTVAQRRLKLRIHPSAQHIYICDYHKNVIQSVRSAAAASSSPLGADSLGRRSRDQPSGDVMGYEDADWATNFQGPPIMRVDVDLHQLQVNTLRRIKKHLKVHTRPGLNKAQLADVLARHFRDQPVAEYETIRYFIYNVRNQCNKLDRNSD